MIHISTAEGISPHPAKVEAIKNLPIPTDVTAVRLCSTVQLNISLGTFQISHGTLRVLTRKNIVFNWSKKCQNAFDTVKSLVIEDTRLAYFDNTKDLLLQVDSSQNGIGTALIQDGPPIEYASKSLSKKQRKWVKIEKELLSVIVGLERFD